MSPASRQFELESHLAVHVRRERQAALVVPNGEVDLASAPELEAAIERAWQSDLEGVIVDLRGVEFMDSTGLRVILSAHRHARETDRRFGIVDGGGQVHKLLSLMRVFDMLPVAAGPEELLDD